MEGVCCTVVGLVVEGRFAVAEDMDAGPGAKAVGDIEAGVAAVQEHSIVSLGNCHFPVAVYTHSVAVLWVVLVALAVLTCGKV